MQEKRKYCVNLAYPADYFFDRALGPYGLDSKLRPVAAAFKGRDTGAGMGFGLRDIDMEFPGPEERQLFIDAIRTEFAQYNIQAKRQWVQKANRR